MDKKDFRRRMKSRNGALTHEERLLRSRAIFLKVEELPTFRDASCVGFFLSLGDEPDTEKFLARWSHLKRIVVPKVEGEVMNFYDYSPEHLAKGAFGIMEPTADAPKCSCGEIDVVLTPGVAFTLKGGRMGRGKGFYDKYLSQEECHAYKIGVCYRHQLVDELPLEEHDVRMDEVVSD